MTIVTYKPTTPARRKTSVNIHRATTTSKRSKKLSKRIPKASGRNSRGVITVRHRGGGTKCVYRELDFRQDRFDIPATVATIEYDPNRSAYIALVNYADGTQRYILACEDMCAGQDIITSKSAEIKNGNRTVLSRVPVGMFVSNVEMTRGGGGKLARSAGSWCQVMGHEGGMTQLLLPSSEIRIVPDNVLVTIGKMSNAMHGTVRIGKAGRKRHMGIRPTVRGSAMNPCDHPHGGGEGKAPIGLKHPKTPWGKIAYGVKTRRKKKKSNVFILKRRKKKKR